MIKHLPKNSRCDFPDCLDYATELAYDRPNDKIGKYCSTHANAIADKGNPEYTVFCPNCGCLFGVN